MSGQFGLILIGDELLSGKRRDAHLANAAHLLGERGLAVDWVRIEHDQPDALVRVFGEAIASGDIVFSYGGIGATPDDVTRPAAAAAAGLPLVRHPAIVRLLEERFGKAAYPNRIRMAEVPEGARLIPNPPGLIPGFGVAEVNFLPGFPDMSARMLAWLLDERYRSLHHARSVEQLIEVLDTPESELVPLMEQLLLAHPGVNLSSLPAGGRPWRVEIGLKGLPAAVDAATAFLAAGLNAGAIPWNLRERL
ncbi:MAG TPA: molybdopterin-binding protein [Gammaproteobacteria bacterium]|nr:molybdopterin-binding protein [Gammaproteobacteria bacterium]